MDAHASAWYGKDFEIAFLKAKGDAFQTFFEQLMSRAYKAVEPAPLPFTYGYQYHDFRDTRSNLIVAQRTGPGTPRLTR